jgi:hypothetical protein
MKLRFLIIPALMATVLLAQAPPSRRGYASGGTSKGTYTPPTAEQLATAQATMIARFLRLDSANTTTLVTALVGTSTSPLWAEETALLGYATTLNSDSAKVVSDIAGGSSTTKDAGDVNTDNSNIYDARVTAAAAVVNELNVVMKLGISGNQLNGVIQMVLGGGPGGGPGFGPRGGMFRAPRPSTGN